MGSIPDYLLIQTVVVVRPTETTDSHGSKVYDYAGGARVTLSPGSANGGAWLQQDRRDEPRQDGRRPSTQEWLMLTNYDDLRPRDRVEWTSHPAGTMTFEVEGPPEPTYDEDGYHHTETTLLVVDG